MARVAPYGAWASPLTLDRVAEGSAGVSFPMETVSHVYWCEARPHEHGRTALVRRVRAVPASGTEGDACADEPEPLARTARIEDVVPGASVRTLVHEYGGLCVATDGDDIYFSDHADQRMYRMTSGTTPRAITPAPSRPRAVRYACPVAVPGGRFVLCVRERHGDPDDPATVVNDVVVVRTDGSEPPRALTGGHDFYAHLAVSPDGCRMCWVSWDHPDMPWDSTTLWEAELTFDAGALRLARARRVAGGPGESVTQPKYAPDGQLVYVSDRTGWWNLYAADPTVDGDVALAPMDADLGAPDWAFGTSSYACLADGKIVATWSEAGTHHLGVLSPAARAIEPIDTGWTHLVQLRAGLGATSVLAVAGSPAERPCVVRIVPRASGASAARVGVVHRPLAPLLGDGYVSAPTHVTFPSAHGRKAHALYYPPANQDFEGPAGERPPLVVRPHSGPTSAALAVCNPQVQFWTTRGFAVADVNYGGSSGYGRAYRDLLYGQWGVVDVEDCIYCIRHLAATGRVDGSRAVIQGGSAGGFTALNVLMATGELAGAATYYAIADAVALARGNHKFELHYNDRLIGPWPDAAALYKERSPLEHVDRLRTPIIVFQGLDDPVVPPSQAEAIVGALDARRVPHAYVSYEGEGHGFRRASTLRRTAEAELHFYGRVLGFTPADELEPVEIVHEDRLSD